MNRHSDLFEQYIRQAAEQFKLQPSTRVWNSLYNNLHPSKRLPSLSSLLLILICFIYLDHNILKAPILHTESKHDQCNNTKRESFKGIQEKRVVMNLHSAHSTSEQEQQAYAVPPKYEIGFHTKENDSQSYEVESRPDVSETNTSAKNVDLISEQLNPGSQSYSSVEHPRLPIKEPATQVQSQTVSFPKFNERKENKLSYQVYATPSVGYRNLVRTTDRMMVSSFMSNNTQGGADDYVVDQHPALNLEAGGAFLYHINPSISVKAGVQLNYSRYNISANTLSHPNMSQLQLFEPVQGFSYLTPHFSSVENIREGQHAGRINNHAYQISLPIGTEFEVAGNGQLRWMAGATIQPGYLISGSSYLLSADVKNYIEESSLSRKWNLNTSVETFISYKLKTGVCLIAGPQFRYQLLSTYESKYIYNEKLYNVGIKVGLMKGL